MSLTERQSEILEGVCQEYIKQARPISSQYLKEKHRLPYSSATIRNEFLTLENKNYLSHPYISSGRTPTDKGYRFFVDRILEKEKERGWEVSPFKELEEMFAGIRELEDCLRVSRALAKTLSNFASGLILTYLQGRDILWKEGWERVAQEPEFKNIQYWRKFLEAVRDFERNIDCLDWEEGKIKIYIGKENPLGKKEISLIITKSSFPKEIEELIAIIGPKRMDFERNISLINSLLKTLKNFD